MPMTGTSGSQGPSVILRQGVAAAAGLALLSTLPVRAAGMAVARILGGIADRGRDNALEALAEQGRSSEALDLDLRRLSARLPTGAPERGAAEA